MRGSRGGEKDIEGALKGTLLDAIRGFEGPWGLRELEDGKNKNQDLGGLDESSP
jgi:hypothetical protein